MTAQALEQSVLESKDKTQLIQIADALGVKANSRTKKADIIDQILAKTGSGGGASSSNGDSGDEPEASATDAEAAADSSTAESGGADTAADAAPAAGPADAGPPQDAEPKAEWELALEAGGADDASTPAAGATTDAAAGPDTAAPKTDDGAEVPAGGTDTTPTAGGEQAKAQPDGDRQGGNRDRRTGGDRQQRNNQGNRQQDGGDGESRSKRRRRRRKGRGGQDGPQGEDRELLEEDTPVSNEPVQVEGYLDMRDEGYGFLRVNNYLASKSDSYIPVKLSRQFGLRKGDHVVGMSRPAGRNEKNPAMLEIQTVNGRPPDEAKKRRRFEDLTALFPDSRLQMENPSDPADMTARIIDLVSPIGKGQRGLIVSPPKAGKTSVMKTIVSSIERNNPECKVIVLLIDERPEEVTDMRRLVKGEVIASTFDKPSDQHTQIAEMAIEKAKRMVEYGEDVVVLLDGITRLSRAYNLAAPASGRILSGGIDAGALYPPKRFFGAARNVEEGGSLTILATALVETNSRMDEAVFEEFKGTGNMELRLDRKLAERRIYPAIDVDASSTRHEELLFDRKQLQMVWKLRRVLSGLAADGNAAPGLELLVDRLKTFRTNDEFLTEIAKQPGM
ncbi:MAG: transcription termination factor Rho [Ilumatobacter sp.]|uniref:transcription termination factor Rho n=1 Tax=Ilumatobacter sp. TaxID=1967498 RepID=UPI00260F93F4|nr:transcription termination factor Rho [Ilumatobacter sp.]MDJ0769370.1 transcription termination factor Rho [Ilumatobacter sp.]